MYFDAEDELPASPSSSDGEAHSNDIVAAFQASLQRLTSGKTRVSANDRVRRARVTKQLLQGNATEGPASGWASSRLCTPRLSDERAVRPAHDSAVIGHASRAVFQLYIPMVPKSCCELLTNEWRL